jgi:hypothetical protein
MIVKKVLLKYHNTNSTRQERNNIVSSRRLNHFPECTAGNTLDVETVQHTPC